jgi:hypothetical protein
MCGIYVWVATAALGIDFGWQRDNNGSVEYIIRLEPQAVEALKNGTDIFSDLPPALRKVRSYRLTTSDAPLPHQGELPAESPVETEKPAIPAEVTAMSPTQTAESGVVQAGHQETPQTLTPDPSSGPILGPASGTKEMPQKPISLLGERPRVGNSVAIPLHNAASDDAGSPSDVVPPGVDPNGQTPAKPWWPLTLCLLGLFASLGGNIFLGWITADQRGKYRDLVQRLRLGGKTSASEE